MTRFFVRPDQINSGIVSLEAEDAHHLRTVLYAQPGQKIAVLDGSGLEWPASLTEIGKTKAAARLGEPFSPGTEPSIAITVAQALPKMAEKMEQVIQRGTEIGASGFWAFSSERSLAHLTGERQEKRLARWNAIIKTAAEQAHRAKLPALRVEGNFDDVLAEACPYDLRLLAYEGEQDVTLRDALMSYSQSPNTLLVIIGPEGGFTDDEVQAARKAGVQTISLGPRILRTETAALVMVSQILYAWEPSSVR